MNTFSIFLGISSLLQECCQSIIIVWFKLLTLSFNRHNFLGELRAVVERLSIFQNELSNLCLHYTELKTTVDQRLKWAVGANPGLMEVVEKFDCEQQAQLEVVRQISALVKSVTGVSQSALQFEALR